MVSGKSPKIAIILGTRAELIKTFPVMLELQKKKTPYLFIHTGQHNLRDLCSIFGVHEPDIVLTKEPDKSTKFFGNQIKGIFWNIWLVFKILQVLKKSRSLRYVIYHGDTMTTTSAALASSRILNPWKKYKNIHLESGLRSGNIFEPFPEEISRIIADFLSDILLAVSPRSKKNLLSYKGRKKIVLAGNTVVDSAKIAYRLAKKKKSTRLSRERFALISIHRHENLKSKKRMEQIVKIISSLKIRSYFTIHDNTKNKLIEYGLLDEVLENKNISLIKPLDYVSFVYQLSNCSLLLCDGGSIQEESLIFRKPCIILRKATERQEGLSTNFQFLSFLEVESTIAKISEFLSSKFSIRKFNNPYGEEGVSKKISDLLISS